jgi:hypothetical protein
MTMRIENTLTAAAFAVTVVLATAACPGNLSHTYKSFRSAVDRGASCSELYDQKARFTNPGTLTKIDQDLARIGCTSPDAARTDR